MQTRAIIEELLVTELRGLCSSCVHTPTCPYYKTTIKEVIQCEQFELEVDHDPVSGEPGGLCKSCDLFNTCKLPGRKAGVWHCNEFR